MKKSAVLFLTKNAKTLKINGKINAKSKNHFEINLMTTSFSSKSIGILFGTQMKSRTKKTAKIIASKTVKIIFLFLLTFDSLI